MGDGQLDPLGMGFDPWLGEAIYRCHDENALRKAACAFARFAVEQCPGNGDTLLMALDVADRCTEDSTANEQLRIERDRIEQVTNDAGDKETDAREHEHEGLQQKIAYCEAVIWARACGATLGALNADSRNAAKNALYEAHFSVGNLAEIAAFKRFHEILMKLEGPVP